MVLKETHSTKEQTNPTSSSRKFVREEKTNGSMAISGSCGESYGNSFGKNGDICDLRELIAPAGYRRNAIVGP